MKAAIKRLDFTLSSPKDLARAILEKIVSIYVAMRNGMARFGDKITPQEAMKSPIPEDKQKVLKKKFKVRRVKTEDPDRQTRLDHLYWIIRDHKLDEHSLKRAQKCIVTYDLVAIGKSEEAFLKAIRRDQKRCTLTYFFGILNNIQNDIDVARYEDYCHERYYYQGMLDRQREKKDKASQTTTVENLAGLSHSWT